MVAYIKRVDALKICRQHSTHCFETNDARGQDIADRIEDEIADITTADVEKVRHGEWIQGVPYRCSICGNPAPEEKNTSEKYSCWLSPRCPHCGAKMDVTDTNVGGK